MNKNEIALLGNGTEIDVVIKRKRHAALFHGVVGEDKVDVTLRPTDGEIMGTGVRVPISSIRTHGGR